MEASAKRPTKQEDDGVSQTVCPGLDLECAPRLMSAGGTVWGECGTLANGSHAVVCQPGTN